MSYYVHDTPGRLRVKIPAIKGNESKGNEIATLLQEIEGVKSTSCNILTGSLLVYYENGTCDSDNILKCLKEHKYIDESKRVRNEAMIDGVASRSAHAISRVFLGWAVGRALEGSGLSVLAALI